MKKSILMFVCFLVLISILTGSNIVSAAVQPTDDSQILLGRGDTYYSFDTSTKTLTIGGNGATPDFTSSELQPWSNWRKSGYINRIVVCEGITYIGNHFFDTVQTAVIELPESLTRIGSYAFADNYELVSISMSNVKGIANNAFCNCSSLRRVFIPATVTNIGTNAFNNCAQLEKVEFGNMGMRLTISRGAFLKCPNLKNIDVPRYASLATYSIGFYDEDSVSEDFTMGVFRDSKAYTYAGRYFINYRLLNAMTVQEGDELSCAYFDDSLDEQIKYYFTAKADAQYLFYSTGKVDVDCELTDSKGNIIAVSNDISEDDLNFRIECVLKAGETYCFTVKSIKSVGEYTLYLLPAEIEGAYIDWNIQRSASAVKDGVDIAGLISGLNVNFVYKSGYVHSVPFEENAEYNSMKMNYASELNGTVTCGENTDYITVGNNRLAFKIIVNHSYVSEIVEPGIAVDGYTKHTCVLCGDSYKSDFTEHLGTTVRGHLSIMRNPQGDVIEGSFLPYVRILDSSGRFLCESDEDGNFTVYNAYDYIIIENSAGPARKIKIEKGKEALGEVGLVFCDFYNDGYINAKDFAAFQAAYGEYDPSDAGTVCFDVNKNGELDFGDWEYAKSFFAYGKLTESVYDN